MFVLVVNEGKYDPHPSAKIHPTASLKRALKLLANVFIGPFHIVGGSVEIKLAL